MIKKSTQTSRNHAPRQNPTRVRLYFKNRSRFLKHQVLLFLSRPRDIIRKIQLAIPPNKRISRDEGFRNPLRVPFWNEAKKLNNFLSSCIVPSRIVLRNFMTLILTAAFFAGLVDAMGGGGGLLTTPALLISGIPVSLVLGTNKVIGTFGSTAAIYRFKRARLLSDLKTPTEWAQKTSLILLAASLGAFASTYQGIIAHLKDILPPLLFVILLVLIKKWFFSSASPSMPQRKSLQASEPSARRGRIPLALIGFYDGLFGPGTGIFFLSFLERQGFQTQTANAIAKIFNLASNIGALIFFSVSQRVDWRLGLSGAACYLGGNFIGAGFVLQSGHKVIRFTVIAVTLLTIGKLLWNS